MKYDAGNEKLKTAATMVTETQEQLKKLQPELSATSNETSALLAAVETQRAELDSKRKVTIVSCYENVKCSPD